MDECSILYFLSYLHCWHKNRSDINGPSTKSSVVLNIFLLNA